MWTMLIGTALVFILILGHMITTDIYNITLPTVLFLLCTGELKHFIEKRRLLKGDLVFIKFRGKLRRAYVTDTSSYGNTVQAKFEDDSLNSKLTEFNNYNYNRVFLPEYLGKAGRILYTDDKGED